MVEKGVVIYSGDLATDRTASEHSRIPEGGHSLASAEEALGNMSTKFSLSIQTEMPDGAIELE